MAILGDRAFEVVTKLNEVVTVSLKEEEIWTHQKMSGVHVHRVMSM